MVEILKGLPVTEKIYKDPKERIKGKIKDGEQPPKLVAVRIDEIFAHKSLAEEVAFRLDKEVSDTVTEDELASITRLNFLFEGNSIGLALAEHSEHLTGLKELEMDYCNLRDEDIAPLAKLTSLKILALRCNEISDLSSLEEMTQLEGLFLGSNIVKDLSPLAGLTKLKWLYLSNNYIKDISPLSGLTKLEELSLCMNQIENVSPLKGLTNLVELSLGSNDVKDITPLASLTKLEDLNLGYNDIKDISPLEGLTNLVEVTLDNNNYERFRFPRCFVFDPVD